MFPRKESLETIAISNESKLALNIYIHYKYKYIFHMYTCRYICVCIYFFSNWKEPGLLVQNTGARDIQDEMDYIAISESTESFQDVE